MLFLGRDELLLYQHRGDQTKDEHHDQHLNGPEQQVFGGAACQKDHKGLARQNAVPQTVEADVADDVHRQLGDGDAGNRELFPEKAQGVDQHGHHGGDGIAGEKGTHGPGQKAQDIHDKANPQGGHRAADHGAQGLWRVVKKHVQVVGQGDVQGGDGDGQGDEQGHGGQHPDAFQPGDRLFPIGTGEYGHKK